MELIDRQAAIDAIDEYMVGKNCATDGTMMASLINELVIKRLPSAQPDIVRCKDCKYWKRSSCCEGYCGEIDMEGFDEDHYCGFAERRGVTNEAD